MRNPRAPDSAYFIKDKTSLKLKGDKKKLEEFIPNKYQATHDLVGATYGFDKTQLMTNVESGYNQKSVRGYSILPPRNNKNSFDISCSLDKNVRITHLLQQSVDRIKRSNFVAEAKAPSRDKTITLHLSEVPKLSEEMQVYFSPELKDSHKAKIIGRKAGISQDDIGDTGYKMTFMVGSKLYLDGQNRFMDECDSSPDKKLKNGLPVKIFNFCYPVFNNFKKLLVKKYCIKISKPIPNSNDEIESIYTEIFQSYLDQENEIKIRNRRYDSRYIENNAWENAMYNLFKDDLKEIFRINLLAVIEESAKQKKTKNKPDLKLPFIVLTPSSFITGLKTYQQIIIKKLITTSLNEVLEENIILVKKHISEVIKIGFNLGDNQDQASSPIVPIHQVNTDMVAIAKELYLNYDIETPLPMMAHPTHPIGNGYHNVLRSSSTDEQLAKMSGNIADLVFAKGVMKANNQIKDLTEPVFKTLEQENFNNTIGEYGRYFYGKTGELNSQHSFSIETNSEWRHLGNIDTAPIFTNAVNLAINGLDLLENYKTNKDHYNLLKIIIESAQRNQGIGNKINELRRDLISNRYNDIYIDKIIDQATKFSANFQREMQGYGLLTGRQNPCNIVGARLHRMATPKNINSLFYFKPSEIDSPSPGPSRTQQRRMQNQTLNNASSSPFHNSMF
jgi:hypothetical protein